MTYFQRLASNPRLSGYTAFQHPRTRIGLVNRSLAQGYAAAADVFMAMPAQRLKVMGLAAAERSREIIDAPYRLESAEAALVALEERYQEALGALQHEKESLVMNEQRLYALFNSLVNGHASVTEDGNFNEINRKFCEMLGYSESELILMSPAGILGVDLFPEEKTSSEKVVSRKDGTELPVQIISVPLRVAGKRMAHITIHDLSQKIEAERTRNLLDIIARNVTGARIYAKDMDGKFTYVNPACAEFSGKTQEEMIGLTDFDLFPREDAEQYRRSELDVLMNGRTCTDMEEDALDACGHYTTSITTKVPVISQGKVTGLVGINFDITRLLKGHGLKVASHMAAGFAHIFNNQNAVALGFLEMLSSELEDDTDKMEMINPIETSLKRMSDVVQKLSAAGGVDMTGRSLIRMGEVTGRSLQGYYENAAKQDIEIKADISCGNDSLFASAVRMESVVKALVDNAVDAILDKRGECSQPGIIHVSLKNVSITEAERNVYKGLPEGKYILLEVKDNGVGMTPGIMQNILSPFFTTSMPQRLGLGLSEAYGIIKKQGGELIIESTPGSGSRFAVFFPVHKETAQ